MDDVNTHVVLMNETGGYSAGFNNEEDLKKLPENFSGCIFTDRIDKIKPLILNRFVDEK